MEKLGVEIDPEKVKKHQKNTDKEKTASGGEDVNVPWDPEKGTEPFEKDPSEKESN